MAMATITRTLMRAGLATMRAVLAAIAADAAAAADAADPVASDLASPLAAHLPTLQELASAIERDDARAVARLEKEIRSWPFVRATLIVPGEVMGAAEVLYLFRNGTNALLEDGVIISLGLFARGGARRSAGVQDGEGGEQVEVGDVVVYGADAALGPHARYWVMLGWADEGDMDNADGWDTEAEMEEGDGVTTPLGAEATRGATLADTLVLLLAETTRGRVAWGRRADSAHRVAVLLPPETTGSDVPVAETLPCPDRLTGLVALVQELLFHSPRVPLPVKARVELAYAQVLDHGAYDPLPPLEELLAAARRRPRDRW